MSYFGSRRTTLFMAVLLFVAVSAGCVSHSRRQVRVMSPAGAPESQVVEGSYEVLGDTEAEARGNLFFYLISVGFPEKTVVQPWIADCHHLTCAGRKSGGFASGLKGVSKALRLPFYSGSRLVDAACYDALHKFSPPADILFNPTIEVKKYHLLLYTQVVALVKGKALRFHPGVGAAGGKPNVGDASLNW